MNTKYSTDGRAEVGDAWFKAAEAAKGRSRPEFKLGAGVLVCRALPQLEGLHKTQIEKRLAQLNREVGTKGPGLKSLMDMPQNYVVQIAPGVGLDLRLIQPGTFQMGSPPTEAGRARTKRSIKCRSTTRSTSASSRLPKSNGRR